MIPEVEMPLSEDPLTFFDETRNMLENATHVRTVDDSSTYYMKVGRHHCMRMLTTFSLREYDLMSLVVAFSSWWKFGDIIPDLEDIEMIEENSVTNFTLAMKIRLPIPFKRRFFALNVSVIEYGDRDVLVVGREVTHQHLTHRFNTGRVVPITMSFVCLLQNNEEELRLNMNVIINPEIAIVPGWLVRFFTYVRAHKEIQGLKTVASTAEPDVYAEREPARFEYIKHLCER
ncbi:hypothetical protein PCE1_003302 [Barthelona sp. PCE]